MKKNLTYEMAQNSDKLDSLLSKMKKSTSLTLTLCYPIMLLPYSLLSNNNKILNYYFSNKIWPDLLDFPSNNNSSSILVKRMSLCWTSL